VLWGVVVETRSLPQVIRSVLWGVVVETRSLPQVIRSVRLLLLLALHSMCLLLLPLRSRVRRLLLSRQPSCSGLPRLRPQLLQHRRLHLGPLPLPLLQLLQHRRLHLGPLPLPLLQLLQHRRLHLGPLPLPLPLLQDSRSGRRRRKTPLQEELRLPIRSLPSVPLPGLELLLRAGSALLRSERRPLRRLFLGVLAALVLLLRHRRPVLELPLVVQARQDRTEADPSLWDARNSRSKGSDVNNDSLTHSLRHGRSNRLGHQCTVGCRSVVALWGIHSCRGRQRWGVGVADQGASSAEHCALRRGRYRPLVAQGRPSPPDSAGISEADLVAALETVLDNVDGPLAAFAEKAEVLASDARRADRLDRMLIELYSVWSLSMEAVTTEVCSKAGGVDQASLRRALEYHSARSAKVRAIEAKILATKPKIAFSQAECEEIAEAAERVFAESLEARVDALVEQGFAFGSKELSQRIGIEFAKIRDESLQEVLSRGGPGMAVSDMPYKLFSRMFGLRDWDVERLVLLRMASLLNRVGCGIAGADIERQVMLQDDRLEAMQAARSGRGAGMFGAM
jgi:hypothetical protein